MIVSNAANPVIARRKFPRIAVAGDFHGRSVRLRVPLVVREASREGFSVESPVEFPAGSRELFHFAAGDLLETEAVAECVHCERRDDADPATRYSAGFVVLQESRESWQRAVDLLEEEALDADPAPATPGASRRRLPRFDVTGSIGVVVAGGHIAAGLHDIGLGGFAVESDQPFAVRSRYPVRFTSAGGLDARVLAQVVHVRQVTDSDGQLRWLSGFAYVIDDDGAYAAVEAVLDHATACLSFL